MIKITKEQAKKRRDLLVVVQECCGGLRSYTVQYYYGKKRFELYDPLNDSYKGEFPHDIGEFSIYCDGQEGC